MAENTTSEKHQALRSILEMLNLPVNPEYFSEGSTITSEALQAIQDKLEDQTAAISNVKEGLDSVVNLAGEL